MGSESLILLIICGILFGAGGVLASRLISPSSKNSVKDEPYECGIQTEGPAWNQFNVGYYLFALVFLIFDVEVVFLFPYAVVLREIGMVAFVEIIVFVFILFLGLLYAWKKKALQWA
jgi:NADH-quinone oxidoreductase subunit A